MVVSLPKVKLFEIKIRFLGFEIYLGKIKPIQRSIEFASNFSDEILDKTQLQRFFGLFKLCIWFYSKHQAHLQTMIPKVKEKSKTVVWKHTQTVQKIKSLVKSIPCLSLIKSKENLIVEIDASNIRYGGILKQCLDKTESIIWFRLEIWNDTQKNYSIVKKELLAIVVCVQKFQGELINKRFIIKTDSRASKFVFKKDVKNLVSKQIFAKWQAILSCFDFEIVSIKGEQNPLADYLSKEFLTPKISLLSKHSLSKENEFGKGRC